MCITTIYYLCLIIPPPLTANQQYKQCRGDRLVTRIKYAPEKEEDCYLLHRMPSAQAEGSQSTLSSNASSSSDINNSTNVVHPCPPARSGDKWNSTLQDQIRDFGYCSRSSHNSVSLLRTTELYGGLDADFASPSAAKELPLRGDGYRLYGARVRQLPPQTCIDVLVRTFFSDVNWQYDVLDEKSFRNQLEAWGMVSYSDLNGAFEKLTPQTCVFPALLFQVLAQALLFHPSDDKTVLSLMTMAGMTFHDLGVEYSATGAEILEILGKKNITISTVQAGVLRASFLKSSGKVVEAWHALGATIRDAQEIGLHTGQVASERCPSGLEEDSLINSAVGHRIWVVLHIWDVHMAVVLGRPIATHLQIDSFAGTLEGEERRRELFSHWNTETDPPRPFDIILAGYNVAYRYFQDIHQLEHNGAKSQQYPIVERLHVAVIKNMQLLPSWCRLETPNTRFDQFRGCQWLPVAREGLYSLIHLVLLTLHRPYIFSVANSRTEALKAGVAILRAQERLFRLLEPRQCKVFNTVYASFDAIVLIAAICLVFPNQNPELRAECVEVVERGMQRLGITSQFNPMAKSAHDVVRSLYRRLKQQLGISGTLEYGGILFHNPDCIFPNTHAAPDREPLDVPVNTVLPPRPTSDLFYDHVSSTEIPIMDTPPSLQMDLSTIDITDSWHFEGSFDDASFWSFMNELNH
ncbi:unnamed protein product [Clonostachys solani]|uniref:Xylanolytic transcriptional activator regulatory domain-containing protein n=1 Tax=Clonostachys solani TaxID=160281 RepID=A0A9P0ELC8_9HYPO|nr:unnamed protein product [Clonostachys solani]